jgi:hypothetical protein
MKNFGRLILLGAALGTIATAQQWEFGGVAGGGFLNHVNATNSFGSATAGFEAGAAFGGYIGHSSYKHIGGELRYGFLQSNLKLTSGGSTATFAGQSHVVHYDVIFHTRNNNKVQLFAAVGGGMKIFRATGTEHASQPLSQFGYFTKEQVLKPMGSVGAGVKFAISRKVYLRTEFRDYITAFPKDIIAPPIGTKYGMLLHDFVPMVGLGFEM